jgi:NO-binding membrane sensor protein with MHYT domain
VAKQKTIAEIASELFELLKAYTAQETIGPLKTLGRYVGWGAGGSALMSVGLFFLALSGLRALQTQTGDVFDDSWSFVPYFIVAVVLAGVIVLAVRRIIKAQSREHRKVA